MTPSTRFALEELQSARGFTLTRENWEALFTTVDGLYKFHKYLKKKNGNEVLIAVLERLLFAIAEEGAAAPAKEDEEDMPEGFEWKTILSTYQSMKKIKNGFSNGACGTKNSYCRSVCVADHAQCGVAGALRVTCSGGCLLIGGRGHGCCVLLRTSPLARIVGRPCPAAIKPCALVHPPGGAVV